jgi:hypothetical protein
MAVPNEYPITVMTGRMELRTTCPMMISRRDRLWRAVTMYLLEAPARWHA